MSSYPKNYCHERNVMGQAISLQGTNPKECHTTRLRVVLHFSSGLVERTKRECAWKSPHARNFHLSPPRLAFLAWGDFHMRLRFARSTIPEEKWGLLVVYYTTRAPRNLSQLWNKKFDDIRNLLLQRVTWREWILHPEKGKDTRNFIPQGISHPQGCDTRGTTHCAKGLIIGPRTRSPKTTAKLI